MKLKDYLKTIDGVYHTTLDPNGPGVLRIHLIPPKKLKLGIPFVVIINGYHVLPIQTSWGVLLVEFIKEVNKTNGKSLTEEEIKSLVDNVAGNVLSLFKEAKKSDIIDDLNDILTTFRAVVKGKKVSEEIGFMTLAKYADHMKAPHRMDLLISSMEKDGKFNCNQKCLHCYACGEQMANVKEIRTEDWKTIIDKLKDAGVPSLTFTGGEPTMRKDLVELVDYSKWFVTRLNTNGILLTEELCKELYKASLDSVQVTLYSYDEEIHNKLVGGNHYKQTIEGINNAINAGLDVSINTPLCSLNKDYVKTVEFGKWLGIKYFSCSGLIPSGNARLNDSCVTRLTEEEILKSVKDAYNYACGNELEISFTSPGWIKEKDLKEMNMVVPSCGACLSNMAVAANGTVLPCQSWLHVDILGNLLDDSWKSIWNSGTCQIYRRKSSKKSNVCQLNEVKK